jgi:hypothetical protein
MPGGIVVAHDELFLMPSHEVADMLYEAYRDVIDPEEIILIEMATGEPSSAFASDMRFATGADIVNLL